MNNSGNKKNVLMLGPGRDVHGGISAIVNSLYEVGLDTKVNLKYIATMHEGSKLKKLAIAACAYVSFLFALKDYDIVHVNASSDSSFMRKSIFIRAAKRRGKKVILHQHGGDFKNYYENQVSDRRRKYMKETLDMTDAMMVLTSSWKDYFGKITDSDKITVIPNGVRLNEGNPDVICGESHDINKILFLGRICKDKGIDELLGAMDRLCEKRQSACLYIGGIYEEESYKAKIDKRKDYVRYLGWISGEEKDKYLKECGILVLPSYYEGFPVSVIEAMMNGCIVLATKVGGIPEIITDKETGFLISPRNEEKLLNAFERIYEEKDLTAIAKRAYERAKNEFSAESVVDRICEIYEKM